MHSHKLKGCWAVLFSVPGGQKQVEGVGVCVGGGGDCCRPNQSIEGRKLQGKAAKLCRHLVVIPGDCIGCCGQVSKRWMNSLNVNSALAFV